MDESVTLAYVHPNEIAHSFHQCLLGTLQYDLTHDCHLASGGWLAVRCNGAEGIPGARNMAIRDFLANRSSDWLCWIDTDMGFPPDAIDRLIEVADIDRRPIVGALCFTQKTDRPDNLGGWRMEMAPTLYDWVHTSEQSGFLPQHDYPINTVTRVAATGSAFILIHRSVFVKIRDEHGETWYDRIPSPADTTKLLGEDLSFCLRAGALNIPVHVHTGVRTTHYKPVWLSERDYWDSVEPPPATESTAVIVPVMRRPQNAEPFMSSLRASTGLATVYAICDEDDGATIRAWQSAGARMMINRHESRSFAAKANTGYERTKEPWLFLVGDDVRFHSRWLDYAQAVAGTDRHVIGTNDMMSERVTSGEHATHMLVRRSYVDEHGASWDGPKILAHEGYHHWYVDDEIVTAAKLRGVWAMAIASRVEHRHPVNGAVPDDAVYRLGHAHSDEDRKLFESRLQEYCGARSSI